MRRGSAISINNDLAPGQSGVALRTADYKAACRVDIIFSVLVEKVFRNGGLDDVINNVFADLFGGGFGAVLS